jgi:hypothetical protein
MGGFTPASEVAPTFYTRFLAKGDFNRDGNADLTYALSGFFGENLHVLFGDGNGGFPVLASFAESLDEYSFSTGAVVVGDFNHDGSEDIAVNCSSFNTGSYVNIYINDGGGGFLPISRAGSAESIVAGDFNRDGHTDLAGSESYDGRKQIVFGDGVSGFYGMEFPSDYFGRYIQTYSTPTAQSNWFSHSLGPNLLAVADYNSDGFPDIADSAGYIKLNIGNGDLSEQIPINASGLAISTADINHDGKPDIVTANGTREATMALIYLNIDQTPVGAGTTVNVSNTNFTFDNVTVGGTTSVSTIDPATAGDVPGGFALADIAFEVSSTATFTGTVTSCFTVSTVNVEAEFLALRVLHNESGALVDRTSSHDFANRKICSSTTSFSPFYLAKLGNSVEYLFDRSKAFKAGSTIPIKLRLKNVAGQNISALTLPLYVRGLRKVGSNTTSDTNDPGQSNPDYQFRFTDSRYHYNLKSSGLTAGRYVLSYYVGTDTSFFYTLAFEVR